MTSAAEAAALEEIWWVIIGTTRFHLVAPSRVNLAKLNLARGRRLARLSGKHLLRDNRRYITSREPKGERRAARSSAQSGHRPGCFGMSAFKGVKQTFRRRPVNFLPECLDDWIDEENAVRAIDAFVAKSGSRFPLAPYVSRI